MSTEKAELFKALAAAQKEARGVEKAGVNAHHRYKYASAEDMIAESRVLNEHGLSLFPTRYDVVHRDDRLVLVAEYTLAHESGQSVSIKSDTPVIPQKGRPEDKAVATAKTYDLGYTLRGVLKIPRIEEGTDVDARDDSHYVPDNPFERAKMVLGPKLFAEVVGCPVDEVDKWQPANEYEARTKLVALRTARAKREAKQRAQA